ncbi:class I adenylate-forming enzyme family protein [Kineobactrum salinum]|uniref:Acyl--CoA ligase n=1 Tax=Kineobactrum salinum TaxID=2708301 RepID=A0A6C0TZM6_9GAMM|nr:class I adenylate-forming enzyme family protein [Kineobactrum salinum]QIB65292.1 acyl--CoA ligase [Kineobactrum salinum]
MQTSSPARIRAMTEAGYWGSETLHAILQARLGDAAERIAVVDQPNKEELTGLRARRISYAELDQLSDRLAARLLERGLKHGDRLLVQLPNISELVLCYYAASKLGVVTSPLPIQYAGYEIGRFARTLRPAAMLTLTRFREQELARQAEQALDAVPLWTLQDDWLDQAQESDAALASHRRQHPGDANDILTVVWTSGTTGTPKGVPRSHNMWRAMADNTMAAGEYQPGEVLLAPFPLVNMAALGGFLFPSVLSGSTLVLHQPMDPPMFLRQIQQERVNFTIAPPALLNRLAQQPELWARCDFSSVRAFGSGSVPLSPAMIEVIEGQYGKPIINFYGSNEGISLFSTPATAPSPEYRARMFPRFGAPDMPWRGNAHESITTRVIDPASGEEILQPELPGELCISGPAVFDGYLDDADEGVFTPDGLFRTGDLVAICGDPPHYYRIVGRCKDIINRGGMKISPAELDILLEGFPGLVEAAVCAYPDPQLEEKICACVVPAQGSAAPDLAALCDWLQSKGIARFKLPERLEVFTALPRNPVGKVVRGELQQQVSQRGTSP